MVECLLKKIACNIFARVLWYVDNAIISGRGIGQCSRSIRYIYIPGFNKHPKRRKGRSKGFLLTAGSFFFVTYTATAGNIDSHR